MSHAVQQEQQSQLGTAAAQALGVHRKAPRRCAASVHVHYPSRVPPLPVSSAAFRGVCAPTGLLGSASRHQHITVAMCCTCGWLPVCLFV